MALMVVPFQKSSRLRSSVVNVAGAGARSEDGTSAVLCSAKSAAGGTDRVAIAAFISFTCSRNSSTSDSSCCTCCCSTSVEGLELCPESACCALIGATMLITRTTTPLASQPIVRPIPPAMEHLLAPIPAVHSRRPDAWREQLPRARGVHYVSAVQPPGYGGLEHHHDRHIECVLRLHQVRRPARYQSSGVSIVASRWRYASRAGEIRYVRGAMVVFNAERDVLARHVIECCR